MTLLLGGSSGAELLATWSAGIFILPLENLVHNSETLLENDDVS